MPCMTGAPNPPSFKLILMMLKSHDSTGTDWMVLLVTPEREGAALSSAAGTAPKPAPPLHRCRHRRASRGPGAIRRGPDHLDREGEREGYYQPWICLCDGTSHNGILRGVEDFALSVC